MDTTTIMQLVPVLTGAAICLVLGFSLFKGSQHAVVTASVFVFGAALCGSAVFSSISWEKDKGQIKTVVGAASDLAEISRRNADAIDALKLAITKIEERISLALAPTLSGTTPTLGTSVSDTPAYTFPIDSQWSGVQSGDFCETYANLCADIAVESTGIVVPKAAYDALSSFTPNEELLRAENLINGNEVAASNVQKTLNDIAW